MFYKHYKMFSLHKRSRLASLLGTWTTTTGSCFSLSKIMTYHKPHILICQLVLHILTRLSV